jgi:hypothetical protein
MKRYGQLFEQMTAFGSLLAAFHRAKRGTRLNRDNGGFIFRAEMELLQLRDELLSGAYRPQPYRYFQIAEPKIRTISVADFRDRVVHHALVGVLEPVFERQFDFDSYATRRGKGTHLAVRRAQAFLQHSDWYLKSDVDGYFASIRHDTLLGLLDRKIKDRRLLDTAGHIIRAGGADGCGLPIGNLTSQFFANVYLDPFDRFVRQQLRLSHYIRYMDDFVLFHPDKPTLVAALPAAATFLGERLHLRLKPAATQLNATRHGLPFLGRRIFPATIRLAGPNLRRSLVRLRARAAQYEAGDISEHTYLQSLASLHANLASVDGQGMLRRLFAKG